MQNATPTPTPGNVNPQARPLGAFQVCQIERRKLRAIFEALSPGMSKDPTRPALGGIFINSTAQGMIDFLSTDGKRVFQYQMDDNGRVKNGLSTFIPAPLVKSALKTVLKSSKTKARAFDLVSISQDGKGEGLGVDPGPLWIYGPGGESDICAGYCPGVNYPNVYQVLPPKNFVPGQKGFDPYSQDLAYKVLPALALLEDQFKTAPAQALACFKQDLARLGIGPENPCYLPALEDCKKKAVRSFKTSHPGLSKSFDFAWDNSRGQFVPVNFPLFIEIKNPGPSGPKDVVFSRKTLDFDEIGMSFDLSFMSDLFRALKVLDFEPGSPRAEIVCFQGESHKAGAKLNGAVYPGPLYLKANFGNFARLYSGIMPLRRESR